MADKKKYSYRFRPGYGSGDMLLEFMSGSSADEFMEDLLEACAPLNVKVKSTKDMWMNDETWIYLGSNAGEFLLTKDIWGFVFITADENQAGLKKMDELLRVSNLFEKEAVNSDDYKLKKTSDPTGKNPDKPISPPGE